MAQCFCGCGHKVTFSRRAWNKRGAIINADLSHIRFLLERGMQSPSAEAYLHDGDIFCAALADAVHTGLDPGPELERETRGFMRFGHTCFGERALGSRIRRAGFGVEEAVALISTGEWDPFDAVEIPGYASSADVEG